jgi:hypothetical protein
MARMAHIDAYFLAVSHSDADACLGNIVRHNARAPSQGGCRTGNSAGQCLAELATWLCESNGVIEDRTWRASFSQT